MGLIDPNHYARPYALPPGVPADRAQALEIAFAKTMNDLEFLAEAKKSKMSITHIPGEQIRKLIVEGLSVPGKTRDKLKPIIGPKS